MISTNLKNYNSSGEYQYNWSDNKARRLQIALKFKMTTVIPNCVKYDPNDASICLECDHYLHFGRVTGRCECVTGTGTACNLGLSCSEETRTCLPMNQCLQIPNCQACKYQNHSICKKCADGYFIGPDQKSCITLDTCGHVKNCEKCSISDPSKCEICKNYMSLSSDGKFCECVTGSGQACPTGYSCTLKTKMCVKEYSCRSEISNCYLCVFEDERECYACEDGYTLQNGQCIKFDDCFKFSPHCGQCDPKAPEKCIRCKNGLTLTQDLLTCECTLGSKQVCHNDQVCAKHYHICVEDQACLSFPSLIQGCYECNYYDPRFCVECDVGLVISGDRLHCVHPNTCKLIKGCNECNAIQPNLCFKCDVSLSLSSTGLACFCGVEDQICQNGTSCVNGSCKMVIQNRVSSGQVAGIVIVVVALVIVIVGLVVFIFVQKRKTIKSPPKDLKTSTSFSKSVF